MKHEGKEQTVWLSVRFHTYGFVLQQRYSAIERNTSTRLYGNVRTLAFEVRAPFVIVMMLMLVQSAVRIKDVVQHWCIRRHRSLCRRRRFRRNRVRRQRQFCNLQRESVMSLKKRVGKRYFKILIKHNALL